MSIPRKVTVIDDDPTMLKAIERLLRVKGRGDKQERKKKPAHACIIRVYDSGNSWQ